MQKYTLNFPTTEDVHSDNKP